MEANCNCSSINNEKSVCNCTPVCGNGILEKGEECDDNNLLNGDGCNSLCKKEIFMDCVFTKSCPPVCGNGIVEKGEGCDDRNTVNGDGCSSEC